MDRGILRNSTEVLTTAFALDAADNVYLTGISIPRDFPTLPKSWISIATNSEFSRAVFAAIVTRDGNRMTSSAVFSGEMFEDNPRIAVNAAGEVAIAGTTSSYCFPTTARSFLAERLGAVHGHSAYLVKIKPDLSAPVYP